MNWNKFINGSVNFISNYLINNHLESMILGISGGIDSTIAAVLCSIAAKKTNTKLIGVSLMCSTNKQDECSAADLVGQAFCNEYYKENIQEPYEAISKFCINSSATKGMSTKISEGNIKARLRMIYLWNLSGFKNGVTIDTDNKTEHELGFFTLMGDQNYLNPGLVYLWKTEVYELANFLKDDLNNQWHSEKYVNDEIAREYFLKNQALEASINLIPTDGNGVSNSDCEQFGLDNYEQVDDVLRTMYYDTQTNPDFKGFQENPIRESEYIRLIDSYNEQGVDKVMILHQNTTYKRKELPIKPTREELELL